MPKKIKVNKAIAKIVILVITILALTFIFRHQLQDNIQENLGQRALASNYNDDVDIIKIDSDDFSNRVNDLIAEYIDNNPEKIVKSLNQWQQQSIEQQEQIAEKELAGNLALIEDDTNYPASGKAKAPIKITMFFDYSCGYCQKMAPVFQKLKANFPDQIQLIYRDLPILGAYSETMARFAMSVYLLAPKNYEKAHYQLLKQNPASERELWQLAKGFNLSQNQSVEMMGSDEVSDKLNQTKALAAKIGVFGTPAMVINGELHRGSMSYSALSQKIKALLAK